MRWMQRIAVGTSVGLLVLLGAGWAGLRVAPAPFPPPASSAKPPATIAVPPGLPAPVDRYFRTAMGGEAPIVDSAVLTGRGQLRVAGVTFPARFRFTHEAGRSYRHAIDCTWFGLPIMRVNESYVGGRARLELPFGVVADEPKVDAAANLALLGEQLFWLPSITLTDSRVHWQAIDAASARLVVPGVVGEDAFTVTFDEGTGLIQRVDALRYRSATDAAKTPWRIEPLGWHTFHGVRVPTRVAVTWLDEGTPWLTISVEDIAYSSGAP